MSKRNDTRQRRRKDEVAAVALLALFFTIPAYAFMTAWTPGAMQ